MMCLMVLISNHRHIRLQGLMFIRKPWTEPNNGMPQFKTGRQALSSRLCDIVAFSGEIKAAPACACRDLYSILQPQYRQINWAVKNNVTMLMVLDTIRVL